MLENEKTVHKALNIMTLNMRDSRGKKKLHKESLRKNIKISSVKLCKVWGVKKAHIYKICVKTQGIDLREILQAEVYKLNFTS